MKKTFKKTSAFVCAMAVIAAPMTFSSFVANAEGEPVTSDYTITIPATLAVENSGWNALEGGISAKGTLESGKKLVVTPTSENSWNLVANKGEETESKVGYNLATTGDNTSVYSATAEVPTWEFTELTADGTSQTAGIIVENYDSKPAGDYSDTVTFTASVVDNSVKVTSITLNKTSTVIGVSGEKTLSVSRILPTDATDKTYTWASDNTSVATVDSNGKVTGVAIGTANITATANDGSGIKATCVVKVAQSETIMVKGNDTYENPYTYVGTNFQVTCDNTDEYRTEIWQDDEKMVITATSGKTIISVDLEGAYGYIMNGHTLVLSSGTIDGNTVNNVNAESLTIGQVAWTQTELGSVTIYYQ